MISARMMVTQHPTSLMNAFIPLPYLQKPKCSFQPEYSSLNMRPKLRKEGLWISNHVTLQANNRLRSVKLGMSLRPLEYAEAKRLLPTMGTSEQLAAFWGNTPEEKSAKFMEVLMSTVAGTWASYFIGFMIGKLTVRLGWTVFVFYWLLAPNYYAYQKNKSLYGDLAETAQTTGTHVALFSARISSLKDGGRSRYSPGRRLLSLTMTDENGKNLKMQVNYSTEYQSVKVGMSCEVLVLSDDPKFSSIKSITDVYVPSCDVWLGEYPYLDKPRFKWLVAQNRSFQKSHMGDDNTGESAWEPRNPFWDGDLAKEQNIFRENS